MDQCSEIEDSLNRIAKKAEKLARSARTEILKMTFRAKAPHVGSALSVVDILAVLYSGSASILPATTYSPDRDVVVLSKGHAASALYSILALSGFFDQNLLESYCMDGALLGGHVTSHGVNGVEFSTGSLGHGLPYAVGIALGKKLDRIPGKVFVVMSDGECDEGTTWESALLANHHKLHNLVVIVDRNRIQSLKDTEQTLQLEPFAEKWSSFGWQVEVVSGHSYFELASSMATENLSPKVIIANTTKGRGIEFMENSVLWHYKSPNQAELEDALAEVNKLK